MRSAEHRAAPKLANGKDTPPRNCVNDFATESVHCKARQGRERHPLGTSRQVHTESCKLDRGRPNECLARYYDKNHGQLPS